ncbi:MAG: prenyltransferase/squalene oxidase repeat-containing protein [Planctomycetota bacterium]
MSLRHEMLTAAESAPNLLHDATENVVVYIRSQFNGDGGVRGRSAHSDLYYTVFALDSLVALGQGLPVDTTRAYLQTFGTGSDLDFVHLVCLGRCWATLTADDLPKDISQSILSRTATFRSSDGGFNPESGAESGTVYAGFLGMGLYQDLGGELDNPADLGRSVLAALSADGSFTNERGTHQGTTPTTAAAVVMLRQLGQPVPEPTVAWLLARLNKWGGFNATPDTPLADLLSTATALHALAALGIPHDQFRESCLDYLNYLWTGSGFRGHLLDTEPDCEYTFYGLLALGHLSS